MNSTDLERQLVEVLEKMKDGDAQSDIVIFDKNQAEALKQVAEWWIAMRGLVKLGGVLGSSVKWFLVIIGGWVAIKAGFLDWVSLHLGVGK